MKKSIALIVLLLVGRGLLAQDFNYKIELKEIQIADFGGVQSFAFAKHEGKYLIIGGRLDGLHRRQPFASFDVAGHNNQLILIDPKTKSIWKKPLSELPPSIAEQLSSTNMQFIQNGNYLYVFGGYGFSNINNNHITFPMVTAIKVSELINSILNNTSIVPYFRQITDQDFAITGGQLRKINKSYYLVGGQRFDGRYNPMGNPSFTQAYVDAYWKFNIIDDGNVFQINNKEKQANADLFHRRDFNATTQILPNGKQGITVYSGVFQPQIDIPYLNSVNIDSSSYVLNTNFSQYYNHYHCANIGLYDEINNVMHTLFFGGIAQYFDSAGILVQDNSVPFVKTIARVSRNANNEMAEYKMPIEMPGFLGAGAEFLANEDLAIFSNEVIKLNSIQKDTTDLGYIFGGINSTAKNIFWTNDGTQSTANQNLYQVLLIKNNATGNELLNKQSISKLKLQLYPNPSKSELHVFFESSKASQVKIELYNESGKLIRQHKFVAEVGKNDFVLKHKELEYIGVYYIYITIDGNRTMQKLFIEE